MRSTRPDPRYEKVLTGVFEGMHHGQAWTAALSVMANGYAAFDVGGGFKPFIGAGIGVAFLDAELELSVPGFGVASASDDDTVFAYQGIVGVEYEIPTDTATFAFGVRYSYFATTDPDFGGTEAEYATHNVMFGVRISR